MGCDARAAARGGSALNVSDGGGRSEREVMLAAERSSRAEQQSGGNTAEWKRLVVNKSGKNGCVEVGVEGRCSVVSNALARRMEMGVGGSSISVCCDSRRRVGVSCAGWW